MNDWLGCAEMRSSHNGGSMLGGPPRMVWHSYECPLSFTVEAAARSLINAGNEVHFVLHPQGGLIQILPASVAARGLKNLSGGVQTNRFGTVCIQVEVIGYSADPFTRHLNAAGLTDARRLVAFSRARGVPDVWPAGPPPAYFDNPPHNSPEPARSASIWVSKGGHYGHSQVPENSHGDPGAVDTTLLLSTAKKILKEDTLFVHVSKTSTDESLPQTAIVLCSGNTRYWLPGNGAALVNDWKAKGGIVPDMTGDDVLKCFPVDLKQANAETAKVLAAIAALPKPTPVDVKALAAALVPLLPVTEPVTVATLEAALRNVFRSVPATS